MKNVLATIIATTMLATAAQAKNVFEQSLDGSSAISEASSQAIESTLTITSDKLEDFGVWLGKQSGDLSVAVEGSVTSTVAAVSEVGGASIKLSVDLGNLVLDIVVAGSNASAQSIQKAYAEGRKVNVTIVNPKAIERAAKGNFAQKLLAGSAEGSNKASETSASVAVSVLASSGELIISPVTYSQELHQLRLKRAADEAKASRK